MFGNIDPKKMQAMMKQMGISQEDVSAERVVIEKTDGGKLIIENPSIQKIKMHGQESFQISGSISEEVESSSEEDVQTIVEKTGVSEKIARETLERTGDLAEAILELSN